MAVDRTPFFVGGGAQHSPEVVRQNTYISTEGAEGVAGPLDLKVVPSSPLSNRVQVLMGGGLMLNRYAGGSGQSYTGRNISQTPTDIIASTGTGVTRSDLVVMRVLDPQYEGQAPADPLNFDYTRIAVIPGVPATTRRFYELNLNYPAIELARLDLPANTANIDGAKIVDLRRIARPRVDFNSRQYYPSGTTGIVMAKGSYASWPFSGVMANIEIPVWANFIEIVTHISGLEITGTGTQVAGVRTGFDVGAGGSPTYGENGIIIGTAGRQHATIIGRHTIPSTRRGKFVDMVLQGNQTVGTGTFQADYQTAFSVDWRFKEVLD